MGKPAFSRWLSRAFSGFLLYINLLAGVLVLAGLIASSYLDVKGTAGLLLWLAPLTVLVTSVLVSSIYATISVLSGDTSESAPAGVESGTTMAAQPRIRFLGWETIEVKLTVTEGGEAQTSGNPWLTRVTFANEPGVSSSGLTAYKVSGHIEFYDAARDRFLFGMVGQWSDGPEEETIGVDEKQIDIPPDATPCYLNIALKYDEDDECYGINHDTAVRMPVDLRDEQRKLGHGLYTIKIMVHGESVAETFWFGLINRGRAQRIRILRISS
jgi:hypothetical protein